ncbi:MAG TPA: hypothetical protein VGA01_04710 [Candidatus Binatia bacterium]
METVMETVTTKGTSVYENTAWSRATPLARATPWLRAAQHKISELARLAENWDSYGSRPIQSMAIEQASIAIEHLSDISLPPPQIFPVPGGGLQLEFEQDGRELEIEFLPDGSTEYLMVASNGAMREDSIPSGSKGGLNRLAYWLQGKPDSGFVF